MIKQFQTGRSHMAIVLQTAAAAQELCDMAEEYNKKVTKKMTLKSGEFGKLDLPDVQEG
jgi:predicted dinucleotide-utilizing enzyme